VAGGSSGGIRYYFVEYPPYFDREALYGTPVGDYPDNAERFAMFSRAVIEASKILGVPQVFHCHDWQSLWCRSCCARCTPRTRPFAT